MTQNHQRPGAYLSFPCFVPYIVALHSSHLTPTDLRAKSLFYGAIMCACIGTANLNPDSVRHAMSLGADWVFTYPAIPQSHDKDKATYPVQQVRRQRRLQRTILRGRGAGADEGIRQAGNPAIGWRVHLEEKIFLGPESRSTDSGHNRPLNF